MQTWRDGQSLKNRSAGLSRLGIGAILVLIGLAAWIVVGGAVLIDSLFVPTPTIAPTSAPTNVPTQVALVPTETPTTVPSATNAMTDTAAPTLTATIPQAVTVTPLMVTTQAPASEAHLPEVSATSQQTAEPVYLIVTATATPACQPPAGWMAYQVTEGDTLFGFQLGSNNTVTVADIMQANCLTSKMLSLGQVVFLPAGVADQSPKVDESSVGGELPTGPSRAANCPCTITVRQGWRLEQIAALIDRQPVSFSGRDFLAAAGPNAPVSAEFGFLSSRPAGKSLEGFMFPGEYTVENATSAVEFRDMLLRAFAANVTPDIQAALTSHGLSLWEAVNMASIIQRESYTAEAQKIIASIFYNRRARGMGLGSFVTLQYALGSAGNWWPRITKANINTDTPYATHRYKGLPPTPVSNPGLTALLAVGYPAQTDYLYMSAKCDGSGNFYARTYEEFQQGLNCN